MRQLKHHERKLLKKVDFLQWKSDKNTRELQVIRQYAIQDRQDYVKCGCAAAACFERRRTFFARIADTTEQRDK